jgi:hypothetical protein
MAFTFTAGTMDPISGLQTYGATTDASSAAGSVTLGFKPRKVEVWDITNANRYDWNDQMAAASMFKIVTAGTFTYASSNGITVTGPDSATPTAFTLTLGTGIHTNSSTYKIVIFR